MMEKFSFNHGECELENNGILLLTGRVKEIDELEFYKPGEEAEIWYYPERRLYMDEIVNAVKTMIECFKAGKFKHIIIVTENVFIIRAVEVLTDIYECMDKLDCYWIDCHMSSDYSNHFKAINLSYGEYGISEVYEICRMVLDELDEMLDKKYGKMLDK